MDQWAMNMNPAFYQGMPNANVDWAQLAAQWIHMRETLPPEQHNLMPSAPPPPKISLIENNVGANSYKQYGDEKGEAPMEVVKESDDDYMPNFNTTTNAISNQMPLVAPQPPVISAWGNTLESNNVQQLNQNWRNPAWQVYETNQTQSHPIINSTMLSKPPPLCPELQGYSGGRRRWSNKAPGNEIPFAAMNQMPAPISEEQTNENENLETLDAAKRKTLPAWIREGLEKMEREKQREEERIKMEEERKRLAEERRKFEAEALHELESTQNLQSKFDNSEDESEYDQESRPASPDPSKNEIPKPIQKVPSPVKNEFVPTRSREEQMQELMLSVRKSLTEILLEVTNEEIRNIARETHTRLKSKVNRAQTLRKTALTSITGGLGLGIYGSESESSDDDADKSDKDDSSAIDSENEIRETMKRKKANFERVIDEIEDYLEKEELAELSRKREWDRKYGFDMERRKQEENRPSSSNSSSSSDSNPRKEINNSGNNKKYNHQQSNESTSGNNNYNNEKNTKRNISDKGEPHHSTDYNSRSSGSRHKARVSRFSDPRDKVAPAELAVQTAKLQKSEHKSKRPNSDENYARTTSNTNVRLDMNQFLRREVTKDMLELLNQVKRARSRSSDSRSTSSSARRSHKKHSKHSSKKSRHRSSSSSSSSTSSSSDSSSRKHKKKSKSSRSKSDKKRRSRSRSRESHRSGKSSSKRTRSRSRDRRSYR